jgi:hypothetical protein
MRDREDRCSARLTLRVRPAMRQSLERIAWGRGLRLSSVVRALLAVAAAKNEEVLRGDQKS